MTNKMVVRDLFLLKSKGTKLKTLKKIAFPSLRLVYGEWVFQMWQKWYYFQQELMVSKMVFKVSIIFSRGIIINSIKTWQ